MRVGGSGAHAFCSTGKRICLRIALTCSVRRVCHQTSQFADEFAAFARADKATPPPAGALLFYGSSSIRLWETLAQDFPGPPVLNRGFGGSTLEECVEKMDALVFPYRPRAVIFYAGDNDLDQGRSPQAVLGSFCEFARRFREHLAGTPLAFISIKPSPARVHILPLIRQTNELIRRSIDGLERTTFIDIHGLMLDAGGRPSRELFAEDTLHLSREGYRVWADAVSAYVDAHGLR
jgi:lysophospholipase L1-like esterase